MFWNSIGLAKLLFLGLMNLKHEMFWNIKDTDVFINTIKWTLNMKCFEMLT